MAQYEVTSAPLTEAADSLYVLGGALGALQSRLGDVLSDLPELLRDFRRQIAAECEAVGDLCACSKKLGRTLLDIADIYAQAEQAASGGCDCAEVLMSEGTTNVFPETHGVLLLDNLIMPDWLQAALIQYEQSELLASEKVIVANDDDITG